MTDRLAALHDSVDRLAGLVGALDPEQLTVSAYPTEWTIADTLSHLGSGAVIFLRRLDDGLAGVETPDDAAEAVWDEWNAKTPRDQTADALVADRALLDRLEGLPTEERERVAFDLGPMTFDFDGVVGLRLNEHALHTWDVEVALDPTAVVASLPTQSVVDNLQMTVRFSAKPTGTGRTVTVATTDPSRGFAITQGGGQVGLEPTEPLAAPDLALPAEAFIRLVYGRLDPDHTYGTQGDDGVLGGLRQVFPGS